MKKQVMIDRINQIENDDLRSAIKAIQYSNHTNVLNPVYVCYRSSWLGDTDYRIEAKARTTKEQIETLYKEILDQLYCFGREQEAKRIAPEYTPIWYEE